TASTIGPCRSTSTANAASDSSALSRARNRSRRTLSFEEPTDPSAKSVPRPPFEGEFDRARAIAASHESCFAPGTLLYAFRAVTDSRVGGELRVSRAYCATLYVAACVRFPHGLRLTVQPATLTP